MVLGTYKEAVAARSTDKRIQEVAQDGGIASALLIYALENNIIEAFQKRSSFNRDELYEFYLN